MVAIKLEAFLRLTIKHRVVDIQAKYQMGKPAVYMNKDYFKKTSHSADII